MHILALDFDGVLCDSSREVFVVAVDTYRSMQKDSRLNSLLEPLRNDALAGGDGFRSASLYGRFTDLLPLGNRAEDFGVSLSAIDSEAAIEGQEAYNAYYRSLEKGWLDLFHQRFYEIRTGLRERDTTAWIKLHRPFTGLADMLRRHAERTIPAVVTAKDGESARVLLDAMGYDGIFDPRVILDKETGVEKTNHLEELQRRTGIGFSRVTFVDDKLNHLVTVSKLGVRPILAGWGFNTIREHALADRFGFDVVSLDTAEDVLFKGE